MLVTGIEVVDASQYLIVRGPAGKDDGDEKLSDDAVHDDSSDDEGDPDDTDPLDDCSISDEECEIVVLNPGEVRACELRREELRWRDSCTPKDDTDTIFVHVFAPNSDPVSNVVNTLYHATRHVYRPC